MSGISKGAYMDEQKLKQALITMNQREAAEHFEVDLATIKRAIKRHRIVYLKKSGGHPSYRGNPLECNIKLTRVQNDILTGSLLGDGFLLPTDTFRIKQRKSNKEYIEYIHREFGPFSTPIKTERSRKPTRLKSGKVSHKSSDWNGEYAWSVLFNSRKHKIFEDLRLKWYPQGKKILPDLELNESILTHWFLQDGCHNKQKNYYKFSTQSFTVNEAERLSALLNKTYEINSDVQFQDKKPVIYVTKTNGESTLAKIFAKNAFFRCFQHKY